MTKEEIEALKRFMAGTDDVHFYKPSKKNDLRFTTYSLIFAGICVWVLIGYVIYLIYK